MATQAREEKIRRVVSQRQNGLVLVLEDIHDPHNVQAIVRTCEAFGIQDVYLIFDKEAYFNPKKVGKSSSSSANKWIDFHVYKSTEECLKFLKDEHYTIVAAVADPKAEKLTDSNLTEHKIAVVVGNEHSGLSETAVRETDVSITIPMHGMIQSLNVSVASAILLYEIIRQRSKNPTAYVLSKARQSDLIISFLAKT